MLLFKFCTESRRITSYVRNSLLYDTSLKKKERERDSEGDNLSENLRVFDRHR